MNIVLLGGNSSVVRPVAFVTRNPLCKRLLSSILTDWKFSVVEEPAQADVVFVERGLTPPDDCAQLVWLSPMPLIDESFLTVPISLTQLYHLLEVHFYPVPRRHIRTVTDASAELRYGQEWHRCQMVSLSDRGGRFAFAHELAPKTALEIEITLAGRVLRIEAEVIYCVPAGDSAGQQPQIGVLFKATEPLFAALRSFIEKNSVENACLREGIALNDPCVSWLEFASDPWSELP